MIKLLVIDVDGTMTDAGIYYDGNGNELKKFCTRDAAGFFVAHAAGIKIMVLTGRVCAATTRRMTEMKVDYLYQNVKDKVTFLLEFIDANNLHKEDVGYIGDDLNDLAPMQLCGLVGCPSDSCQEVINMSNIVSKCKGGQGAVRDIVETYMKNEGLWDKLSKTVYGIGI